MQVILRDSGDLKRLARDLRDVADGRELRKELTGRLRDILRPLLPVVRAAYRSGPSGGRRKSPKGRGKLPDLRVLLAKSVRVEVRTVGKLAGARIRADGRRMPDRMKSLPSYWEGDPATPGRGRWRHPLFGDREVWVQQASHPTFYRTIEPHTYKARIAASDVVDDITRKLEARR